MVESPTHAPHSEAHLACHLIFAALLLAALFGLATGSALDKSPVVGEGTILAPGWAFWRTGHLLDSGQPLLPALIGGLGMMLEPELPAPTQLGSWQSSDVSAFSRDLLWQQGINTNRTIFLGRLPTIWLAVLLGAVIWRWGRESYGLLSAAVALGLYAFSPTVLASAHVATPHLLAAALYVTALYAWTRTLHRKTAGWLVVSGLTLGSALLMNSLAVTLLAAVPILAAIYARRNGPLSLRRPALLASLFDAIGKLPLGWLWSVLLALTMLAVVAALMLWGTAALTTGRLDLEILISSLLRSLRWPPIVERAYLLGRFAPGGWWYYPFIALGVKVPLPALTLIFAGLTVAAAHGVERGEWQLLIPTGLSLGLAAVMHDSGGGRSLLPELCLLFLFASRLVADRAQPGWAGLGFTGVLWIPAIVTGLLAFPDYLSFTNLLTEGADGAWQVVGGPDLDQGQDLLALSNYLRQHGVSRIYLSYYGDAPPSAYGIDYLALPGGSKPEDDIPQADFPPLNPAPGLYVISANHVIGIPEDIRDTFAYFRNQMPVTQVGGSLYVYEVLPIALPVSGREGAWFAQCTAPDPVEREETLRSLTGISDLRVFNFDCQQSLPFPDGPGWLLLPAGINPVFDLGQPNYTARFEDGSPRYHVWRVGAPPEPPSSTVEFPAVPLPVPIAGTVELLGYQVSATSLAPGEELVLKSWWRVREPPLPPVSLFAYLLAPDGSTLYAADGVGVVAENWRPGTIIIQQHRFAMSTEISSGSYTLAVGLKSLSTGEAYPVSQAGDRVVSQIVLRSVQVEEE